jgi:hypothetical protein
MLLVATLCLFTFIEPLAFQFVRVCCFQRPRRGQQIRKGTLRPYSIEELEISRNRENQSFTYNVVRLKNYRRALLLLNNEDIDQADELLERNMPQLDPKNNQLHHHGDDGFFL